jgi:MFS family permease
MSNKKSGLWTYENRLVLMMFIVFGLVFFERLNITYLFPYMAPDLGLNNTQIGLTVGILGIAFGISTAVFSYISDFLGAKKGMLITFIMLFGVATLLGGFVGGIGSLLLIRAFMGFTEGPVIPLIHSFVISESQPKRRGLNMGIVQSASNLFGSALAPIITIALATSLGWRSTFYIAAVPAIIMGFILMKALRKPGLHVEGVQAGHGHGGQGGRGTSGGHGGQEQSRKPTRQEFFRMFRIRNIWLSVIIAICNLMFMVGIGTFAPTVLAQMSGFGDATIGLLLSLMGFMFFAGQVVAPAISDRIGRKPTLIVFSFFAIFLPIGYMLFYDNFLFLLISVILFGFANGYQPLAIAVIPGESAPRVFAASAIATMLFVSEVVGGSIAPIVSGILADMYGLTAAFWLPIAAAVVVFLCAFGIKESAPAVLQKRQSIGGPDVKAPTA